MSNENHPVKVEIALGKLIVGEPERDAIHIAVAPVVANERLAPGQGIGLADNSGDRVWASNKPIGIVDPFLKKLVFVDQSFWMFLYPNTITSLRHEWEHPAFGSQPKDDPAPSKEESEAWLREFSAIAGMDYDDMIRRVKTYIETSDPWVEEGTEIARDAFDNTDREVFWKHMKCAHGIDVSDDDIQWWYSPFSCSC